MICFALWPADSHCSMQDGGNSVCPLVNQISLFDHLEQFNAAGLFRSTRSVIEHESNDMKLTVQFSAIGTAITERKRDHVIPTVQPALSFTDLRPGHCGETRELTIRE